MDKPIRVAHVMGKMNGGGVEAVVMNYYRNIDRDRVQFDFLVDDDSKLIPENEIRDLGGRVFKIPSYQRISANNRCLKQLFQQEQWEIVHSHMNALSVFPLRVAKSSGVPVRIAHSHSTSGKGELAKNVMKTVLKTQSNRYPTYRMACSSLAGDWLFGKNEEYVVLNNAIDLEKFRFNPERRIQTRYELGISDNQFVVGHIGRFMEQKNHKFLVDSFVDACNHRDDMVLVLAGDGPLLPSIRQHVQERGISDKVMFLGQRDDPECLYDAFDVFALPSLYEGLCLVGVEAQASAVPCLLSNPITREIDLAGRIRFLPIDEESVWADSICSIADSSLSESDRIADCAADLAAGSFESFDIKKAAPNLVSCYEDLVRGC